MNKNIFIHLKKFILSPLFVGILFFLFLQLQLFNLGLSFRDEGYMLNNASRITDGELPYANFFLAITPGAYYIQAFLLIIFGKYIITGRFLYIICTILILILSSRLFKLASYKNYIYLISLGIMYAGKDSFASYNIESLIFILISILFFSKLNNENNSRKYPFLIGFMNSIVFVIKQSYGTVFFLSFSIFLAFFLQRKHLIKNLGFYFLGNFIMPLFILTYFFLSGAQLQKLVEGIFDSALSVKNDRLPFILTAILFIPFFIFIFNFIKKISPKRLIIAAFLILLFLILYIYLSPSRINYIFGFYRDASVYYFLIFFTFPIILINSYFKSKHKIKKNLVFSSIIALSLFLASAFSGRDYATVVVTAPLYIPIFLKSAYLLPKKIKPYFNNIVLTLLLIIFILPSLTYLIQVYGKLYGLGYKKELYASLEIKEARNIYIPINQKKELDDVISYVKKNKLQGTKLFCFPYCPLMNYLTKIKNASYYSFFYKFNEKDQHKVIKDLKYNKNLIIILQRKGPIEKEAEFEDKRLAILKEFILKNYKLVKTTQNFYIFKN